MRTNSLSDKAIPWIVRICLILLCVVTIYPFWYVFIYSISNGSAASSQQLIFLPVEVTMENYRSVFQNDRIVLAFFVSVARTVLGTLLHLIVTGMAAYALSKRDLVGRKWMIPFFVIPMYFSAGTLPYYVTITKLHLTNNFLVYILPTAYGVFNMLLMKVFFEQLPNSLEEAARIDGAGEVQVFTQIVLPSCKPILATVAMYIGVDQWNSWFDTLLFISNKKLETLQSLLYKIILESQATTIEQIMRMAQTGGSSVTAEAIKMTTVIVATIPIICVYPFLQKYFVKGMMIGAVKG